MSPSLRQFVRYFLRRQPNLTFSLLQFIIKTAIWYQTMPQVKAGEADPVELMFGSATPLFQISWYISMLGGYTAIAMSLKTGVCRVVRPGWSRGTAMGLVLCWTAAGCTIGGKMVFLRTLVSGTSGEETMKRVALWAAYCLLPNLLLSLMALLHGLDLCAFLSTILQHPALIITPALTSFTFGRYVEEGQHSGPG